MTNETQADDHIEEKAYTITVTYIGDEDYEDIDEDSHLCEGDHAYTGVDEDDVLDKFHDDHPCDDPGLYDICVTLDSEKTPLLIEVECYAGDQSVNVLRLVKMKIGQDSDAIALAVAQEIFNAPWDSLCGGFGNSGTYMWQRPVNTHDPAGKKYVVHALTAELYEEMSEFVTEIETFEDSDLEKIDFLTKKPDEYNNDLFLLNIDGSWRWVNKNEGYEELECPKFCDRTLHFDTGDDSTGTQPTYFCPQCGHEQPETK